jgi:hypothetical protein
LEELRTIERIREVAHKIDKGEDLPSSDTGDFLQADGVEVTDDDLYEDV